jgi:hypothetical protein
MGNKTNGKVKGSGRGRPLYTGWLGGFGVKVKINVKGNGQECLVHRGVHTGVASLR